MAELTPYVSPGFEWRRSPAGRTLVSLILDDVAPHLFSTRDVSPPDLGQPDYGALAASFGVAESAVVRVRQVHGCGVLIVKPGDVTDTQADADAVVSLDPSLVVSVRVADCVPILLADRRRRVVAAVHAGWRGTAAGVVTAALEAVRASGVPASDLVAAIGPSIGPCCYQVDAAVRDDFLRHHAGAGEWFTPDGSGRWRLDLWSANVAQLRAGGVPVSSIARAALCTADDPGPWYSHRREGAAAGRMVAAIRLRA